jgi:hypothetical protein
MSIEMKKDKPSLQPFKTCTGLELANAAPETYHGLVDDLLLDVGVSTARVNDFETGTHGI